MNKKRIEYEILSLKSYEIKFDLSKIEYECFSVIACSDMSFHQ